MGRVGSMETEKYFFPYNMDPQLDFVTVTVIHFDVCVRGLAVNTMHGHTMLILNTDICLHEPPPS